MAPAVLHAPARLALAVIAGIVAVASLVSFAESYRGLYLWARAHDLTGLSAAAWPCQVDAFIAVGELALFVALVYRWPVRARVFAWAVALAGLAVSVAGNVGHAPTQDLASRVTWAVPPIAAAAALAVGLGVLKRVVAQHHTRLTPLRPVLVSDESETGHLDALDRAASDADRIRYACDVVGSDDTAAVFRWLVERDRPVSVENIRTVVRRRAALNGQSPQQ
jgi:Protein of unknown function (DUF2637)